MNRLLSRSSNISLLHRQIIQRRIIRELSIGTSLCWRGGNEDKKQYGRAPVSWFNVMPMAVAQDQGSVGRDGRSSDGPRPSSSSGPLRRTWKI